MGTSFGDFLKFPRTPHLFGSTGTNDDRYLNEQESVDLLANESLTIEEKVDGTNVGIHFSDDGTLILQCRGHLITEGMHPQYDLFKKWAAAKQHAFSNLLGGRFIVYGEWMYAAHTMRYSELPHYFLGFDVYDKGKRLFLGHEHRAEILHDVSIHLVPALHVGPIDRRRLEKLIATSRFSGQFDNPSTGRREPTMEGLYLRTESDGYVDARAKFVRPEFVVGLEQNSRWRHQAMVPNVLAEGADIWS